MVAAIATLDLLKAEIEGRIADLVPNVFPQDLWRLRSERARTTDILRTPPVKRMFEVGPGIKASGLPVRHTGPNSRVLPYDMPITILYPTDDPRWRFAAMDDYGLIEADFLNNRNTEPRYVEMRTVVGEPTFNKNPTEPWEAMTLIIRAYVEVV